MRPTPTEIRVPFQVGASGGIDFTVDPVIQATQHIMAIVTTAAGERVMRPDYGTEVYGSIFEADDPGTVTGLIASMRQAIRAFAPNVLLQDIRLSDTRPDDGLMQFFISFSMLGRENEVHEASIEVGGTVFEQTYTRGT